MIPDQVKVYDLICKHDGLKPKDIATKTGFTVVHVYEIIRELQAKQMIMYFFRIGWVTWQKPIKV